MPASQLPFAILLDTLDDEYQVAVLRGALSAARDLGVALLCLPGGRIDDPAPERACRNAAFELVDRDSVRGVLAVSSVIGSAIGAERLSAWLGRFRGLPLCSVGLPLEGHVAVEVDNSSGIRELVLHLAQVHRRRHIAFVRGPSGSAEALARLRAYEAALVEAGLSADPRLVVDGDFLKPSGVDAVRTLLDERGLRGTLDAVATANDYMALGVMQELWRRHIEIPDEIAVVGFDDVDSARLARPALTTASQPTELLGRRGLEAVFALAEGGQVSSSPLLTKLVVRSSCGCATAELGLAGNVALGGGRGVETSFVQRRQAILAEMARAATGRLGAAGSGWETRLLDALISDLRGAGRASFYRAFEQVLLKLERAPVEGIVLQDVLSALRRQSLPCVTGVPGARDQLEDALHEARVLASLASEAAVARRGRVARDRQRAFEHGVRSALFAEPARLSQVAAETLPEFGLEACVVAALERPSAPAAGARLVFGFGPRDRVLERTTLQLADLPRHPAFAHTGRMLVGLPLVAQGQSIGVALVATSKPDDAIEQLGEFLGAALDTWRRVSNGRAT